MPSPLLQARGLSAILPDGRILFSDLDLALMPGPCALVGRNGQGKSTLLRLLAAGGGGITVPGGVGWLPQDAAARCGRVVDLLGLGERYDALQRLSAGQGTPDDVCRVADDWDLVARLERALADVDLPCWPMTRDGARLSAGQRQQLHLLGLWLSDAEVLLLDEPGTWLDADASAAWCARLRERPGAVLVAGHDPAWLAPMPRLLELGGDGLLDVDGGLAAWQAMRAARDAQAHAALAAARSERDRLHREAARERERIDRRCAQGRRIRRDVNQSPLLLDHALGRSERSAGRQRHALQARLAAGVQAVGTAHAAVQAADAPVFLDAEVALPPGRRVLSFERAHPCNPTPAAPLDWHASGPVRVALQGHNGSGKTTLLRALRGETGLAAGRALAHVPVQSLDALHPVLPPAADASSWLQACTGLDATAVSTRLALLGLRGACVGRPMASLSGGERMRVALAAAAWARPAAPLLLLDEPASHLDADSTDALAALLRGWPGALVVVSHDAAFVDALAPSHRLRLASDGLRLM